VRRALVVLFLAFLASAWTPARAANADVDITDFKFTPSTITVNEGDTVFWHQKGRVGHSVTADDGSFDSSPGCDATPDNDNCLKPGDTFSVTLPSGTFAYHCKVHRSMTGTIVVNPEQLKRQVEGGTLMGVSEALYEEVAFDQSGVHEPRRSVLSCSALD